MWRVMAMKLKPSYATPYGDAGDPWIHAYTDAGEASKKAFLRDGRTYFLAVARVLKPYGFESLRVHANRAGIAVSGDVHLKVWSEARGRGIRLSLSDTSLQVDRCDRLAIVANVLSERTERGKGKQLREHYKEGPNVWLSASLDAQALAEKLFAVMGIEQNVLIAVSDDTRQSRQLALFEPEPVMASADSARHELYTLMAATAWPTSVPVTNPTRAYPTRSVALAL
jgi:hypothetical protein